MLSHFNFIPFFTAYMVVCQELQHDAEEAALQQQVEQKLSGPVNSGEL